MRPEDRYVRDVMAGVFAAPEDRDRFATDLRAHFDEARTRGDSAARVIESMGPPEEAAAAFNAERPLRHAGFWLRTLAFVGDCGLLAICALPVLAMAIAASQSLAGTGTAGAAIPLSLVGCVAFGLFVFYFPLLEWRFGKTLGKHLLRLRVISERGTPVTLGRAFVRRLSLYFELLWIDALFIPFTDRSQRALDVVARTVVAREPGRDTRWTGYAICLLLPAAALSGLVALVVLCAPS